MTVPARIALIDAAVRYATYPGFRAFIAGLPDDRLAIRILRRAAKQRKRIRREFNRLIDLNHQRADQLRQQSVGSYAHMNESVVSHGRNNAVGDSQCRLESSGQSFYAGNQQSLVAACRR
jgi:hypothetical protein